MEHGAVGATSNPVIVGTAVKSDPDRWLPEVDALIARNPTDTEIEIAWKLIAQIGEIAARDIEAGTRADGGRGGLLVPASEPHAVSGCGAHG